jgi:hypothetical protein
MKILFTFLFILIINISFSNEFDKYLKIFKNYIFRPYVSYGMLTCMPAPGMMIVKMSLFKYSFLGFTKTSQDFNIKYEGN